MNDLKDISSRINTHWYLHTLLIDQCSCVLLVELLGNNRLLKLRNLNIKFPYHHDREHLLIIPSHQTPLNRTCVPELRRIKVEISAYIEGILCYFEDLYRCEQLEQFTLRGRVNFSKNADLPTAYNLQRWLVMPKSKRCNVRLDLSVVCGNDEDKEHLNGLFTDYTKTFGSHSCDQKHNIAIRYPINVELMRNDSKDGSEKNDDDDYSMIATNEELDIEDSDHLEDKWIQAVHNVSRWNNLRRICILGDCTTDPNQICLNLPILLYVAQRAPRFCELEVQATLAFGLALSFNIELCTYLADHLEVLRFCSEDRTSSFLELVQVVDTIYSYSSSSSLKKLTIFVDADPASWLTLDHFQSGLRLVFNRFPKLIHFTLFCCRIELFKNTIYDLTALASEWYKGMNCPRSWSWRSKPHIFDIWF
ncbi:unnamed protein product [Rotaria sp. Silwood1]|nr:unnamed protein product [Rotaria sp. Silwood1]